MKKRAVAVSSFFIFFFAGSYYLTIYYLPLYFQSVDGSSAIVSGVKNLLLILSVTVAMIASGLFISATGQAAPVQMCGSAVACIGAGLLYTLEVDSNAGKWIGYQLLGGIGWGVAFPVSIIIAQGSARDEDMSSTTAIILCA